MIIIIAIRTAFDGAIEISLAQDEDQPADWNVEVVSARYLDQPGFETKDYRGAYTLPTRTIKIPNKEVEPLLLDIRKVSLPSLPPFTAGLDGKSFRIEIVNAQSRSSWEWWGDVPNSWAPLADVVNRVMGLTSLRDWPTCKVRRPDSTT